MRAVIIANGWLNQGIVLSPEDLLIAADGGARHCLEKDLHPAYVVGDIIVSTTWYLRKGAGAKPC